MAELAHSVRPSRVGAPRPSWMCPKTASAGCVRTIAAGSAGRPHVVADRREVAVPERRRVRDQEVDALGDRAEALGQIVLAVGHEDAAAPARRPVRHLGAGGSGGEGGCGSSAFGRTRRRGHQGEPYRRAPASVTSRVVQERPGQPLEDAAIPPPGEVAVARDADDRARRPRPRRARARVRTPPRATAPGWAPVSSAYGPRSPAITTRSQGGTTTPSSRPCRSASAATRTAPSASVAGDRGPFGPQQLVLHRGREAHDVALELQLVLADARRGAEQLREVQDRHVERRARPASRPSAARRRARGGRAGTASRSRRRRRPWPGTAAAWPCPSATSSRARTIGKPQHLIFAS